MTALSVNLNKIALIRNSRKTEIPNIIEFATICIGAGAHGITIHPRPDQRHIRPSDAYELSDMLTVEFNIEGNPFAEKTNSYPGFLHLVKEIKPTQCTLVPDSPNQLTSDHGWDLTKNTTELEKVIQTLQNLGIRVSLFLDPNIEQVKQAKQLGTDRIEFYTGPYAESFGTENERNLFKQYSQAILLAQELGIEVNAGHDLNLENLPSFLKIPNIKEVSIGHALTVDALKIGLVNAIKEYLKLLR